MRRTALSKYLGERYDTEPEARMVGDEDGLKDGVRTKAGSKASAQTLVRARLLLRTAGGLQVGRALDNNTSDRVLFLAEGSMLSVCSAESGMQTVSEELKQSGSGSSGKLWTGGIPAGARHATHETRMVAVGSCFVLSCFRSRPINRPIVPEPGRGDRSRSLLLGGGLRPLLVRGLVCAVYRAWYPASTRVCPALIGPHL